MSKYWGSTAVLVLVALCGCNRPEATASQPPAASVSASAALPSVSAQPSASASASASAEPLSADKVTAWSGHYTAKKAKIETPKDVKDVTWKGDDGSKAVGEGTLTISVKDGLVQGKASGALGEQVVSGVLEDNTLRVWLSAQDPGAAEAMSGTLLGQLNQGTLTGTLRCAGVNGAWVREGTFELKPSK